MGYCQVDHVRMSCITSSLGQGRAAIDLPFLGSKISGILTEMKRTITKQEKIPGRYSARGGEYGEKLSEANLDFRLVGRQINDYPGNSTRFLFFCGRRRFRTLQIAVPTSMSFHSLTETQAASTEICPSPSLSSLTSAGRTCRVMATVLPT